MNPLERKMNFLSAKLLALETELSVSREILETATLDVRKLFNEKYKKSQEKQETKKEKKIEAVRHFNDETQQKQKTDKQVETEKQTPPDSEVKKLFKKIAHQCHPDKLAGIFREDEKAKKLDLYHRARKALEDNDIVSMTAIASELDVPMPEVTPVHLKQIEKKITAIKKELNRIESSLVWHWFFTEDQEKKSAMLNKIFELLYANNIRS